jgi:hypothetical protein
MTTHATSTGTALQQMAAEKMRAERLRLATEVGIFAVLALLVPMLLDYDYFWPLWARCLAEMIWIGAAVLIFKAAARQWRRWKDAKSVALDLEGRHPQTHCEISTAAEYAARPEERPLQADLVAGLQRRSEFHLRRIGPPYRRQAQTWVVVAVVEAVLFLLLLMTFPSGRLAVQRILLPWTGPTYTTVAVQPGRADVPMTSDLEVSAKFSGRQPEHSRIEWRSGGGAWQNAEMKFTAEDAAVFTFKDLRESFSYRVAANDGLSPEYRVTVYPTPDIGSWQIDVVPPAYAKLPAQQVTNGDVAALRGSELAWRLVPTRPLTGARLHFEKGLADFVLHGSGAGAWTGSMTLGKSADYRVGLVDADGHANLNPARHHLVAVPDAPPQVVITSPDEILVADPRDKVPITIEAQDDIGLASVDLHYRQPGHPVQDVALWAPGRAGRTFSGTTPIDLAPLQLKPYDVVVYFADAKDNNTYDGPGVGKSRIQIIVIRGPKQPKQPANMAGSSGGMKVDLTQLEQALMNATALTPDKAPGQNQDLASQQRQIQSLAQSNSPQLQAVLANPDAAAGMKAALDAMGQAEGSLEGGDRSGALDQEGVALAGLMRVSKYLPPDADGDSPGLRVDDGGRQQAQRTQAQQALAQALSQTESLAQAEQALAEKSGAQGSGRKDGDGQGSQHDPAQGQGAGHEPKEPGSKGHGLDPLPDPAQAGSGTGITSPSRQGAGMNPEDASELGRQQAELAQRTQQLADLLAKAAEANPAISHGLGQTAQKAVGEMNAAAQVLKRGDKFIRPDVSDPQTESIAELENILDVLQNTIAAEEHGTDAGDESVPPEYAGQLSRYFQKLSHEK